MVCPLRHVENSRNERTYNLEAVSNDAHSHKLLSVVTAVHHERVGEALNDGALGLPEALDGIATGGVGDVDGGADLDVIAAHTVLALIFLSNACCRSCIARQPKTPRYENFRERIRERNVPDLNVLVAPLVEQLDAANLVGDVLGQDGVAGRALDLDFAVRHDCDVLGVDWGRRMGRFRDLSSWGRCRKLNVEDLCVIEMAGSPN